LTASCASLADLPNLQTQDQDTARKRKALAKALTITEVHGRLEGVITQRVVRYSSIRWGLPPAAVITP
jgi:hypothetical protein